MCNDQIVFSKKTSAWCDILWYLSRHAGIILGQQTTFLGTNVYMYHAPNKIFKKSNLSKTGINFFSLQISIPLICVVGYSDILLYSNI